MNYKQLRQQRRKRRKQYNKRAIIRQLRIMRLEKYVFKTYWVDFCFLNEIAAVPPVTFESLKNHIPINNLITSGYALRNWSFLDGSIFGKKVE